MNSTDRETLRELAGEVRRIAELAEMRERRARWMRHNALKGDRPLILCLPEGAWRELLPSSVLTCADGDARGLEDSLRTRIYWWEHIRDDAFVEPWFNMGWRVTIGNFGVDVPITRAEERGSYVWDPPIKDLDRDLPKLRPRALSVDRQATQRAMALAEETFGVSPQMFDRFVLEFQAPLLERFGLVCYGCCEPIEHRMPYLAKRVPNMRRVSVSPFSDQRAAADALAGRYIYSRKPLPTLACAGFDEAAIRQDIRTTLQIAGDQTLEIILKDTHTVQNEPERLTNWTRIALEEVDRHMGA